MIWSTKKIGWSHNIIKNKNKLIIIVFIVT